MRLSQWIFFLVALCLGALCEDKPIPSNQEIIMGLGKVDEKEVLTRLETLYARRFEIRKRLTEQLASGTNNLNKCAAAYLLGMYRMEDAVPDLAKSILLTDENTHRDEREFLWDQRPAVEALIKIGTPAIPKMIDLIQNSVDFKTRQFATIVVLHVDGEDVGIFRLEKALEAQKNADQLERLRIAIQFLKDEDKRRHPPPSTK